MFKRIAGLLLVLSLVLGMSTMVLASESAQEYPNCPFAVISYMLNQGIVVEATFQNGYLEVTVISSNPLVRNQGTVHVPVGHGVGLALRQGPGTHYSEVDGGRLPNGTLLTIRDMYGSGSNVWLEVRVTNTTRVGWVHSRYVV
jgi:hypothetical protein